jgi:hypothetical protein
MSNRDELLALAERVEALDGPDRDVDAAVAKIIGHALLTWRIDGKRDTTARAFTASLDAAMSLVPEGWGFVVGVRNGPFADCFDPQLYPNQECEAATPALALTAAALRALAEQEQ